MTDTFHTSEPGQPARTTVATRLQKLIEANHSLAAVESLKELMPRLIKLAREVTDGGASSFLIYNPDTADLTFFTVQDNVAECADKLLDGDLTLKLGEGIAGHVALTRKPLNIEDTATDHRFSAKGDRVTGLKTRNLICVPVVHGEDLLGVIEVLNARDKAFFNKEDLSILQCFSELAAVAIVRARLMEARLEQQKIAVQLEAAAKIQKLFQPTLPALGFGSRIWATTRSADVVGGDLYDAIPLNDGSYLIYTADVSGKGLPAALIMAALTSRIRSEAITCSRVGRFLQQLNNGLHELLSDEGFFATIVIGKYWPETGRVEIASGGHLPALVIRRNTIHKQPRQRGLSLGVQPVAEYTEESIVLEPGDALLLMTDGVIEAESPAKELLGMDRIADLVRSQPSPPYGRQILSAVTDWYGGGTPNDDVTIVEIWR